MNEEQNSSIPFELPTAPQLYLPQKPCKSPALTILVPALNEEATIEEFCKWCQNGLERAGIAGQILIIDSSSDDTPNIARQHGAEVLRTPKLGLGRAYIDAIPYIRGAWVIMGDADLTYDFRNLDGFIEQFKQGAQFIMGSRFRGTIEKGAMPPLHQYFGTPLTTWILNTLYSSQFTDIHCGMRGITTEMLKKLYLTSQSWEYASEMVLKAAHLQLKIKEVPVAFYKDRNCRVSHHKRMGWVSPWIAGWKNLKVMLIYAPDKLLFWPGTGLGCLGLLLCISLVQGSLTLGGITFNLYWMLLGITLASLGYSFMQLGTYACLLHGMDSTITKVITSRWTYNKGIISSALFIIGGLSFLAPFALDYVLDNFQLHSISNLALFGLLLVILGAQTFSATVMLELIFRTQKR